jgi:hypothetical protein
VWVKDSANIQHLVQPMKDTLYVVSQVWAANGAPTPVVTSGNDGQHAPSSLHYQNAAIDLRANNVSGDVAQKLANDLAAKLGDSYDVLYEQDADNPANNHIHVEYDPDG